jgi:hypothetical protein
MPESEYMSGVPVVTPSAPVAVPEGYCPYNLKVWCVFGVVFLFVF